MPIIQSDDEIRRMICCEKNITSAQKRFTQINKNMDRRLELESTIGSDSFTVFISYSMLMEQDFSIGLMYDGHLLYRLNGFHGVTKNGFYSAEHHAYPHAHILTMDDIVNGRARKPSYEERLTGEYIDLATASAFFIRRCSITNGNSYFKTDRQMSIFNMGSEENEFD